MVRAARPTPLTEMFADAHKAGVSDLESSTFPSLVVKNTFLELSNDGTRSAWEYGLFTAPSQLRPEGVLQRSLADACGCSTPSTAISGECGELEADQTPTPGALPESAMFWPPTPFFASASPAGIANGWSGDHTSNTAPPRAAPMRLSLDELMPVDSQYQGAVWPGYDTCYWYANAAEGTLPDLGSFGVPWGLTSEVMPSVPVVELPPAPTSSPKLPPGIGLESAFTLQLEPCAPIAPPATEFACVA